MQGWNGTNFGSNWIEGFGINLGPGWVSCSPVSAPNDCGGSTLPQQWLWMETATNDLGTLTVGPGYFYEGPSGVLDGNPGNDWGDFGTDCQWSFCVILQVSDLCDPLSLLIEVTPYADGTMGSWGNESCFDGPFQIFNGNISGGSVSTPDIVFQRDTVCLGSNQIYYVNPTPFSDYEWSLSGGGTLTQSGNSESAVLWSGPPGEYAISVQETNIDGCVGDLVTSIITVSDTMVSFDDTRTGICLDETLNLVAFPSGGFWSGENIIGNVFTALNPGEYNPVYTVDIHGCLVKDSVEIFVRSPFEAPQILNDLEIVDLCLSSNGQIYTAEDDPTIEYTWHVDGRLQPDTDYELYVSWIDSTTSHVISVYGRDTIGCVSETGYLRVDVKSCFRIFVPNSFTPNGDGYNDAFKISALSVYEPHMLIYNRYGMIVHEIKSINQAWNGDDGSGYYCPSGVYDWILTYKDDSGFGHIKKGHVVLIR
jgi:gliding motility-associated-like protein